MSRALVLVIVNYLEERLAAEKHQLDYSQSDYQQKGRYLATLQIRNAIMEAVRNSLDAGK